MPSTVEEVVGRRIRERRTHLGWTQEELGRRLGGYLEKPWPRQAVYEAERGLRAFRAVELVAIAQALDLGTGYLLSSLDTRVRLPSGAILDEWTPASDDDTTAVLIARVVDMDARLVTVAHLAVLMKAIATQA